MFFAEIWKTSFNWCLVLCGLKQIKHSRNQARSQEFAVGRGYFGGWKQHQTILTQILIGLQSD